ncbi:MAG: hypothetical protein LBI80_06270 [Endomicrobium sp.]|nr:hypothetical protein [Endomicrobium sp.]
MKKFTNHTEPWGDFLDVKISFNPLNVKKLIGKKVLIETVPDAYNKYEKQILNH